MSGSLNDIIIHIILFVFANNYRSLRHLFKWCLIIKGSIQCWPSSHRTHSHGLVCGKGCWPIYSHISVHLTNQRRLIWTRISRKLKMGNPWIIFQLNSKIYVSHCEVQENEFFGPINMNVEATIRKVGMLSGARPRIQIQSRWGGALVIGFHTKN